MNEYERTGNVTKIAQLADLSRPTARKYLKAQKAPAELQAKHTWRTRPDPLVAVWPEAEARLKDAPELEAKALFEYLQERYGEGLAEKHLRTFQRRVQRWRMQHGPDKEVFFTQDWEPGRAMQMDWTHASELGVTIQGQPYGHLLCHQVLPRSNWEWATPCQSESMLSAREGLQEALHQLGRVPAELRVDHSSAATHQVGTGQDREFNEEFSGLCQYFGMTPKTIGVGRPNENGDVESSNGHLKRRLVQHLLLRGSRDFESLVQYVAFLHGILNKANLGRRDELAKELAVMKPLPPTRLAEYDELVCRVSSGSTIRVKKVAYSVPARWIGAELKVEVYESQLKLYTGRELLLTLPRHRGTTVALDYRHVVDHLLRKPGAFEGYRYREQMFPSSIFRQTHDRLVERLGQRRGAVEYLRLLKLASEVGESDVELMLVEYTSPPYPPWSVEEIRQALAPRPAQTVHVAELTPECTSYDRLLTPEVAYV
jgi:transposase